MKNVKGRAVLVTPRTQFTANIESVATIGKEDLTRAETSRAGLILSTFEGSDSLFSSPFVRKIFFPDYPLHTLKWPELPATQPNINFTYRPLNESQRKAVKRCLSNKEEDRHVVIVVSSLSSFPPSLHHSRQGPPGTGETTVIAAVVQSKVAEHRLNAVWVTAQSNVAVKNVVEKLVDSGFLDFKLLVSKDFHYDW